MKRFTIRRAGVVLVALVSLAACSNDGIPANGSMPGALTKRITSYSGDEFYAFVQKLAFNGGQDRARDCRNNPTCTTTVRVDDVTTQDSIGRATAPQYGTVYVRANNEYYMIISADSAKGLQWRLERLDTTPNARRHVSVGTGPFVGCKHKWLKGARADFKSCERAATASDSAVVRIPSGPSARKAAVSARPEAAFRMERGELAAFGVRRTCSVRRSAWRAGRGVQRA